MHSNTLQPNVPSTATPPPAHRRAKIVRRLGTVLGVGLLTGVGIGSSHQGAAVDTVRVLDGCTVSAVADRMTFNVSALLTTVRVHAGQLQVLHDVRCPDGRAGQRWIVEP